MKKKVFLILILLLLALGYHLVQNYDNPGRTIDLVSKAEAASGKAEGNEPFEWSPTKPYPVRDV